MKKSFSLLAVAAIAFASCSKTDVKPSATTPAINNFGASVKAKPVPSPAPPIAGGGGPGGGGGGNGGGVPVPVTNLSVYTKQLIGGWQTIIGTGEPVPFIPNATGTITMLITFKSDGTFTLASIDNVTKAQITGSGTWQFTIPANLHINESGQLVLTSGGTTLLSGLLLFVRPGIIIYQTPVNHLDKTLANSGYVFQKV